MVDRAARYEGLTPGAIRELSGDVTTLNWIKSGAETTTEKNLGYRAGRFSEGYVVALLVQQLTPEDFHLSGTTLRSGGRLGLASTISYDDDRLRPLMRETTTKERGRDGYVALQKSALGTVRLSGAERIAKVIPRSGVLPHLPPRDEFPMGGGALQWTIKDNRAREFLIALRVDPDGTATTASFGVSLAVGGYDARQRIRRTWRPRGVRNRQPRRPAAALDGRPPPRATRGRSLARS